MRRYVLGLCLLLSALGVTTPVLADNARLTISDVRGSGRWDAQIASAAWMVTVDGIVARHEMTLAFKDTVSSAYSDSLELYFSFDLPAAAVVDSLYLWIAGRPVPGLLLERQYASQIYEQIVRRRRDPALLTKSSLAPTYELRIFPFKRHEQRTVKICYYLPLGEDNGRLRSLVPLLIATPSLYPPGSMSVTAVHAHAQPAAVTIALPRGFGLSEWQRVDSTTVVTATAKGARPDAELMTFINDERFAGQGLAFQFANLGGGQWAFLGLVNPGRLVGYRGGPGLFYPANLDIDGGGSGFVFDVFGLQGTTYPTSQPLTISGMVRGSDSLLVAFNGVAGDSGYAYRGAASADRSRATDRGVAACWASRAIESRGLPSTTNATQNLSPALTSLLYGILTPYTALLAIEPNMELGFANQQNQPGTPTTAVADRAAVARPGALTLDVSLQPGCVSFALGGLSDARSVSLRIYDMLGRLVADLTGELAAGRRTALWRTAGVPPGTYVARLTAGGTTLVRQFSTAR